MAKPTAVTEFGGSKVRLLADSTAVTPAARADACIESAPSGEATYPVGWAGVATHRQGQALTGAGGFTTSGAGPVVLAAGLEGTTVRAVAVDSTGRLDTNSISGQVGVQGGNGVVTSTTQRVCLATNVNLPPPGTTATELGKAVSDIAGATDTGVAALAVRDDALTPLGAADADYAQLRVDSVGALWVRDSGSSFTDDSAYTVAVSGVSPIGGILSADAIDAGDVGAVGMTAQREMRVQLGSAGTAVSLTGSRLHVESSIAAAQTLATVTTVGTVTTVSTLTGTTSLTPGVAATNLGKQEDVQHASSDVGVMALGVRNDSVAQTSLTSLDGDYSAMAVDIKGNSLTVGNLPHDAVDAGNPVKIGGKASTAAPTAVANADRVDAYFDLQGRQVVKVDLAVPVRSQGWDTATAVVPKYGAITTAINNTAFTLLLAAPSAGRYLISSITISGFVGTAARTTTPKLHIKVGFDATGATPMGEEVVRYYVPNIAGEAFTHTFTFPTPIRGGTDLQAIYVEASAAMENTGEWTASVTAVEGT